MAEQAYRFVVSNGELEVVFTCANHQRRINETVSNLHIDTSNQQSQDQLKARFVGGDSGVSFRFDDNVLEGTLHEAVFFENTDYPLLAKGINGSAIDDIQIYLSGHYQNDNSLKDVIRSEGGMLFGALNFKNQVGLVDFDFVYHIEGKEKSLKFTTEVLSYKMNYRTDMKALIQDIEREYSMLSYSFLKQTYLSFQTKQGQSTELIWWQIFQSCYHNIISATNIIINSPKRRLKTAVRHERAERLSFIAPELETEYAEHEDKPNHLYRTEELFLSKDTIENRFLKHVVKEVYRRFGTVKRHIINSLNITDQQIGRNLEDMESSLLRLKNHRFFKGIGVFKGFAQDSMVMKQARGYKDIYRSWIELQCGYELEEGMRKLEVKDISDLYEIWCFIKVKNIVSSIVYGFATEGATGKELTTCCIRQLAYGAQSEVKFKSKIDPNVELASVMYNAQVEDEENSDAESAIGGTVTYTTVQRPDIVLRLSKTNDDIQYTYLFDAKYRIADKRIDGLEVPPVDAINQMHRYRDAIYYDTDTDMPKREIIGGYVLYPGNMKREQVEGSYYQNSIDKIGIGAFPLKPSAPLIDEDGNIYIDPESSESVLYEQIRQWLNDNNARFTLLRTARPQHGLEYRSAAAANNWLAEYHLERYLDTYFVIGSYHDEAHWAWINGKNNRGTHIYNVRLDKEREGAQVRAQLDKMKPKFAILYQEGTEMENKYHVFRIHDTAVLSEDKMRETLYPREPQGSYYLFRFDEEVSLGDIDISELISRHRIEPGFTEYSPLLVKGEEVIKYRE